MLCKISQIGKHWTCEVCGFTHDVPFKRQCPMAGRSLNIADHRGLGDTISAYLLYWGLKARSGCDCEWRRSFLNKLAPYEPKQFLRNIWLVFWILASPALFICTLPVVVIRWWTVVPETEADRVAKKRAVHEASRRRRGNSCPLHPGPADGNGHPG